jgi:hypothetical protein
MKKLPILPLLVLPLVFLTAHTMDRGLPKGSRQMASFGPQRLPAPGEREVAASKRRVPAHRAGTHEAATASLGLPLEFEANRGQAPAMYNFNAHGTDYALGIAPAEIAVLLFRPQEAKPKVVPAALHLQTDAGATPMEQLQLHLRLLGANPSAAVSGIDRKPGVSNYFIGNDPANWRTQIPHYGRLETAGVYDGIDLVFYGNPEQLEYDFRIAPAADPQAIRLEVGGAASVALDAGGDLVLSTAAGAVRLKRPEAYQQIDRVRKRVRSEFRIAPGGIVRFAMGSYDHSQPLVIDPVLLYSAAMGGTNGNQALGIDVDAGGNTYVTGNSCSTDFPTTAGSDQAYQGNSTSKVCQDAFVLKLDPTASTVIYSDFVGGSGASTGTHLAVDASGDAFVTGATVSANFPLIGNIGPVAPGPCAYFVPTGTNCPDGFIFKLSPDGSSMIFSSLLGGSQASAGYQVKLNPVTGDVVVLGETNSSDFTPNPNMLESTYLPGTCANTTPCLSSFLLGLNPTTGAVRYGTFLGGAGDNFAAGLAIDGSGNLYVAGSTQPPLSAEIGAVTHTYAPSGGAAAGGMDIFVAQFKLNQTSLSLGYLTLIQGESDDIPSSIAVDSSGNAYLTGSTASQHLPVTPGVFQSTNKGNDSNGCLWSFSFPPVSCGNLFVGKLNSTGTLSFLTYLGGSGTDWGEGIGPDSSGNIWLTASTDSVDFPFTTSYYPASGVPPTVSQNPLLAQMSGDGTKLSFASVIGSQYGRAADLKIDSNNNIYIARYTGQASQMMVANGALSTPGTYGNGNLFNPPSNPIFVQKWGGGPSPESP